VEDNGVVLVQSHGDFAPRNAFIDDVNTTLLGLDHSCVADPALDLARFINSIWRQVAYTGQDPARAESLVTAFLDEYGSERPENVANVPFYWGLFAVKSLAQYLRITNRLKSRGLFDTVVDLHVEEFEYAARIVEIAR
jgi:aminoglycoside phosphotransferase (APT) family kinase protein